MGPRTDAGKRGGFTGKRSAGRPASPHGRGARDGTGMTSGEATVPIERRAGRAVLFVMAVPHEYGPHLRARLRPLFTGVGPVEAAVAVTAALAEQSRDGTLPDLVVSLGSAGSATLAHAAVYQAASVSYRDMNASPLGFEPGRTPFLDLPALVDVPLRVPDLPAATLSTGADVISGPAYARIASDMVDMETWAVMRACHRFAVPLVALRGVSDGRAELGGLTDWTDGLHEIDRGLAEAVDRLWAALEDGSLALSA